MKDIHDVLEVTVYDEDKDHKYEFLGKVKIPLLRIHNNVRKWYLLKEKKLRGPAKGDNPQILLEMFFVYNKVSEKNIELCHVSTYWCCRDQDSNLGCFGHNEEY